MRPVKFLSKSDTETAAAARFNQAFSAVDSAEVEESLGCGRRQPSAKNGRQPGLAKARLALQRGPRRVLSRRVSTQPS